MKKIILVYILALFLAFTIAVLASNSADPIRPNSSTTATASNWDAQTGCTVAAHYDCIDEDASDGDTTNIVCDGNTLTNYDMHTSNASFSDTQAIKNLTIYSTACAVGTQAVAYSICANVSGTVNCSANIDPSGTCSTYGTDSYFFDNSPATGSEWTVDEINTMNIGVKAQGDCNPNIKV